MNLTNAYSNPDFNGKVDIDTNMPVICMPIKNPYKEEIIAIF